MDNSNTMKMKSQQIVMTTNDPDEYERLMLKNALPPDASIDSPHKNADKQNPSMKLDIDAFYGERSGSISQDMGGNNRR